MYVIQSYQGNNVITSNKKERKKVRKVSKDTFEAPIIIIPSD